MADLRSYIKQMLNRGYNISQIRNALLKQGYPEQAIDQAVYSANDVHHTFHLGKSSLIAIVAIIIGLVAVSFFIYLPKTPTQLLDLSISRIDKDVNVGQELTGTVELSNFGSKDRFDVNLKIEIFDANNNRLAFKSETFALATTTTKNFEIRIPEANEGVYSLRSTARYQAETAVAAEEFRIKASEISESCFDGVKNQDEEDIDCGGPCESCQKCGSCDDNDDSTRDYCSAATNYECRHDAVSICGDGICSSDENSASCPADCQIISNPWDDLDKISKIAETNPSEALNDCASIKDSFQDKCLEKVGEMSKDPNVCDKIAEQYNRDRCFSTVARETKQSVLCEQLSESKRDSCYTNFVIDGDYTVCDKIQNTYLKESCERLREANV